MTIIRRDDAIIKRDGEYIIKTILDPQMRKYFDFESYKKFRSQDNDWLVEVFDYDRKTGEITMAYIEGSELEDADGWRSKISYHELWNVCMTWRTSIIKKYFDFALEPESDPAKFDPLFRPLIDDSEKRQFFYHADFAPHNVIMQDGKPILVDPNSFSWSFYSDFIVKQNFLNEKWWLAYLGYAHRRKL